MKYINLIANLIVGLLFIVQPVMGQGTDYTSRNYMIHSCKLFAKDAYQAADNYSRGVVLQDVLELIDSAHVADNMKHRAFQAIQFVWKNQLNNSVLAYSLAMGLCLKPKKAMAPIDEPWLTSPRTSKEFF
jgi:hypothetical protein